MMKHKTYESFIGKDFEITDSLSDTYNKHLLPFKKLVLKNILEHLKEVTDFKILSTEDGGNGRHIVDIETPDKFTIFILFNDSLRKLRHRIWDDITEDWVQQDETSSNSIASLLKKMKKELKILRSDENRSKRMVDKYNL